MPFTTIENNSEKKLQTGIRVSLEPGVNVFNSLKMLQVSKEKSGLPKWVYKTASSLPKELRWNHQVVLEGLHYVVEPDRSAESFPEYIHHLANADPFSLRQKMFDVYTMVDYRRWDTEDCCWKEQEEIKPESVLGSLEDYFKFLELHFGTGYMNPEVEKAAYNLIIDPPAMQKFVVEHMWRMWEGPMSKEWRRVEPLLQRTVDAFQRLNLQDMSLVEAYKTVYDITGDSDDEKLARKLKNVQEIIFVPSAHVGPYQYETGQWNIRWMFFPVHSPRGMKLETPELNQTEILVRLNALTDETRLKILQLIASNGPLTSSEVIEQLGLSQSAASRHLMQLSATGYLTETRVQAAKQYAINPLRIDETMQALAAFLRQK